MAYRVVLAETAIHDATEFAAFIRDHHLDPRRAGEWLDGLEAAIGDLADMPRMFRVVDEQALFAIELRQFVYHSHRVIYHVDDAAETVVVLRVYHGRRDVLRPEDIQAPGP